MSWTDHPSAFGSHPWTDPFAPQDFLNPRPDQDLAIAGARAPRPEDFPYTDQGQRDYYDAVRVAAQRELMMQHAYMAETQPAQSDLVASAASATKQREACFLLLLTP
jgi:hypothetical protein